MVLKIALLAMMVMLVTSASALKLKYQECMDDGAIKVNTFEISPYPPNLSQGFKTTYDVDILKTLGSDITVSLTLQRKMGKWIEMPCTQGAGSCKYNNFCSLLDVAGGEYMGIFGLPTKCPFNQQKNAGEAVVSALELGAAGAAVGGDYKARMEISGKHGNVEACLELEVTLA